MRKDSLTMGALVVATTAVLAGCGGDSGNQVPSGGGAEKGSPPKAGSVTVLNVRETEMKLEPENPEIEKPATVQFKIKNAGRAPHALEVEGPKGEVETRPIKPGQSDTLSAELTEPGKYTWYCPVGNHKDLGMRGTITVGSG
jgi:uncharacterized cupredoxin-like copper-binding protein